MDRRRFLKYASATLASTTLTNCHNLPESNVTDCLMNDAKWSQFKSELTGKVICPTDLDYRIASQTKVFQ